MYKIAHIVNSNSYSGLEKVVATIMEQTSKHYDMIYVTKEGPIIEILKEKNLPYYIIKSVSRKEIKKFIKDWKPDIIHAHDHTASIICSLVKGKIPLIEHIHNNSLWLKKICLKSFAFLFASLKADKVLIVSDSIKKEYIFANIIKKKIIKVSNPVSYKEVVEQAENVKIEDKEYDICCVGRLVEQKAPEKFVEIIQKLTLEEQKIKAIWVGTGELYAEIQNLIKEKHLDKNIELVGYQKNPYIWMKKSKIFILASKFEGYGLVAFEALALGLPAVVSSVGGLPEVVDNKCGKLCNTEEDFITETLKLLQDEKYYNNKSVDAIKRAKSLDNIPTYIKKIEKIYLDLKED